MVPLTAYIFMLSIKYIQAKCGDNFTSGSDNSQKMVSLYPISHSMKNQTPNILMVSKDIVYREEFENLEDNDIITFDYCNDVTTLVDIILHLCLDLGYYWFNSAFQILSAKK